MDKNVNRENFRIIKEKGDFDPNNIHFLDHEVFYQYLNQINDMNKLITIRDLLEVQFADPVILKEKSDGGRPSLSNGGDERLKLVNALSSVIYIPSEYHERRSDLSGIRL